MWFLRMISRGRTSALALALFGAGSLAVHGADQTAEFPEETRALVAATTALFEAVENTAPEPTPRIRIEGLAIPANLTLSEDASAVFPKGHGPVAHLTGYRVNWYPVDRLLGAVDFMGTYDGNRGLVCGYVTWDLSDTAAPQIDQLVATYLDLGDLARTEPHEAHATLLDANCAYGDLDLNFTVFDPAG